MLTETTSDGVSTAVEPTDQKSPGSPVVEAQNDINDDIDPENEVTGVKLLLIHIAICLCTFLIGLVSPS